MIKFNDLGKQWEIIKDSAYPRITSILENCPFILGPDVATFERNFAKWNNNTHCIGVSNGTDALRVATLALGFDRHVHIYTQANTFIATVFGPEQALNGDCTIHLIDHDDHFQMDVGLLEDELLKTISVDSKSEHLIIPVHLYGHPCDMTSIMKIAKSTNARVLEDCSQAHGAVCDGQNVGTFGDISAFSCYPGKNLGAAGDAGLITTNNTHLDSQCRLIRNMGSIVKYEHIVKGANYRLDTIQAAILDEKLVHLSDWNSARRKWAKYYSKIDNINVENPLATSADWCNSQVYHVYPILINQNRRSEFMEYMESNGVQVGIHYPICIEETVAYADQLYSENVNVRTRDNAKRLVSIPIHPFMTADDCETIVSLINNWK